MKPDVLARVHAAAFADGQPWATSAFETLLTGADVILCGDARSFVLGRVTLDEAEVLTVATDPAFQRQGRALAALTQFEAEAASLGATQVFLEVAKDNNAAKQLYKNMNFDVAGQRPRYYSRADGERVDAILMRKPLVAAQTS